VYHRIWFCCFSCVAYLAIKFRSEQEMGRDGEVKSKVVRLHIMTAHGEWRNSFLTLALDGSEWSGLGCFTSSTHWRRGCLCPRACNDALEKKKFLLFCQGLNHDFSVVRHIACSRCNDYSMPAHQLWMLLCRHFCHFCAVLHYVVQV
jgi:hypothetical protein